MKRFQALASIAILAASGMLSGSGVSEAKPGTIPYQAYRLTRCGAPNGPGEDCPLNFPVVAANHRMELNHVSCYLLGAGDVSIDFVQLIVRAANGATLAAETLPVLPTGEDNVADPYNKAKTFSAVSDTFIFATAGAHVQADARSSRGFISTFACNIDGHYLTLS